MKTDDDFFSFSSSSCFSGRWHKMNLTKVKTSVNGNEEGGLEFCVRGPFS